MTLLKNPRNMLILLFITLLLLFIFIILRHHCTDAYIISKKFAIILKSSNPFKCTGLQIIAYFSS
jgi:hypothetical protein